MKLEKVQFEGLVGDVLDVMSLKMRTAIILKDYHGLTFKEMAKHLNVCYSTAVSRVNRARRIFEYKILHDKKSQRIDPILSYRILSWIGSGRHLRN